MIGANFIIKFKNNRKTRCVKFVFLKLGILVHNILRTIFLVGVNY